MRTSNRARPSSETGDLQITPLIDCVFLLLTYFLFTISLSTIEGLLPSQLALGNDEQEQQQPDEQDSELIVRIVQSGQRVQYFLDDWPTSDFAAVSKHLGSIEKDTVVVVDAGSSVAYAHVVRLYNRCLQLKIERVVFPLDRSSADPEAAPRT